MEEVPSRYPTSDAHLVQVQPVSQRRSTVIANHSSKTGLMSPPVVPPPNYPAQPSSERVIPALESLSLVHPSVARVDSTAGSASNPLVGALRVQSKGGPVARIKHAATMPVPVGTTPTDADNMQKFR